MDPAGDQYLLEDLAAALRRRRAARAADAPPPGQLDLSGTGADPARMPAAGRPARGPPGRAAERRSGARGMSRLYDEVERPLVRVLARMEDAGVRVDVDGSRRLASELASEARRLEAEIQDLAGDPVRRQLDAAAAGDPVQQARPHPAEEDQDRLLH